MSTMSFEDLAKEVSFGVAVIVFQEQLPDGLLESMNMDQVQSLCEHAVPGSELYQKALHCASRLELSCHDWVNARKSKTDPGLCVVIDYVIMRTARTFDDYRYALLHSRPESWLREYLEAAILAMDLTIEEWARIAWDAKGWSETCLKTLAVERFVDLADRFEQLNWRGKYATLFDRDDSDDIRFRRIKKSLGLARTLEEWENLQTMIGFRDERDWSHEEQIIREAAAPLAVTYDDWHTVYFIASRQDQESLMRRAKRKMWTLAKSFNDFWHLATSCDTAEGSRGWHRALQKAAEVGTFTEWDDASTHSSGLIRQLSVRVMADKASSIDECRSVLFDSPDLPEPEMQSCQERMIHQMLELATTPREISIAALYATEYKQPHLHALAVNKLRGMAGI